jgi:hypothetical protein
LTVENNHHGIVLLLVVTLRKMHHEGAAGVIHVDFFLGLLGVQMSREQSREAREKYKPPAEVRKKLGFCWFSGHLQANFCR